MKKLIKRARSGERVRVVNARAGVDLEREFDTTHLPNKVYGRIVHRDYAAHFFRWGWAHRFVDNDTVLLDIGCGKDAALPAILSHQMGSVPKSYLGVDLNDLDDAFNAKWARFKANFNFVEQADEIADNHFTLITCFEVLEHMNKRRGKQLLERARMKLKKGGKFLLSTPVYNHKAQAANHIYEWEQQELADAIRAAGLEVEAFYGTFAPWNKIRKVCTEAERNLLDHLSMFLSNEVLANFLAPKYPQASSNIAWVLRRAR